MGERFLLVQRRFMGDVLLCTPAIRELRRCFPAAHIDFLSEPAGADALAGNSHLDAALVWPAGVNALRMGLRLRGRYDTVVDFRSTPSTTQLAWLTRAKRRIGVSTPGPWRFLYTDLVPRGSDEYIARQKLSLLEPLGVAWREVRDLSLEIAVGEEERRRADEVWTATGLDRAGPVVAVSPVSREPFKQWGAERWRAVVAELRGMGFGVLVTSGPGERAQAEAVAAGSGAVWDYGTTTLRELAALYQRCILWVGNDGGPKHVAAAAGTPTVTVIRWRLGKVWTEPEGAHRFVEREPPGGCDHPGTECKHEGCLDGVQVSDVMDEVRSALGEVEAR